MVVPRLLALSAVRFADFAMRSDDVVEHYSDLWLELVVLDSLVEHIDASDIDESFSWREFSARAAAMLPPSDAPPAAMLPPSDAPPTEAELFARLDLTLADVRRANSAALESLGSADAHGDDAAGGSVLVSSSPQAR